MRHARPDARTRMLQAMARLAYSVALHLALPWILARLWWRGRREPGYRHHVLERLGRYGAAPAGPVLWLHAVSVGEMRAAAPLVRALAAAHPLDTLLLSCTTAAGRDTAQQLYGGTARIVYLPYDLPWAVGAFLAHHRPRIALVMETEIWPNLFSACARAGIPILLANARLSRRSARGYARAAALLRPAFEAIALACAQGRGAARRLSRLGAAQVAIAGNLKFDVTPDPVQVAAGAAARAALGERRVLLLASTREGEEAMLLDALAAAPVDALVLLVPRHPQRFDEVAALVEARGLRLARRSRGDAPLGATQVHLGDTMGEMAFYYALADVAVVGGSFKPFGGQNLIEACAVGAPVIVGPSGYNFPEAVDAAIAEGAALRVADAAAAIATAQTLLADAARRAAMRGAGLRLCEAHRGAAMRHLAHCRRLLAAAPSRG